MENLKPPPLLQTPSSSSTETTNTAVDCNNDYSTPNTQIYCEDDYFAEISSSNYHLKCDHSKQTVPESPLPFNYFRFNEYLRLKREIERVNRSLGVTPPQGLEFYTDEKFITELIEVYGELDEKSERFQLIFQNYKEQRLEEIQEWIEREAVEKSKVNEVENDELLDPEVILLQHFTEEEEIISFKAVKQLSSNSWNPFDLPRKTSIINANDAHGKQFPVNNAKRKQSNNNSKGYLAQRREVIATEAFNILQQHPMGLTRNKLLAICNERLGRKAPPGVIMSLNSEMIDGYLTKEKILIAKGFFQDGGIIFPVVPHSACKSTDPTDILWNLRHKLLVILNLYMGIVEISECIDLYHKIFKSNKFPYKDWGFDTDLDLIKWLFVQKWNITGIEVIQLNLGGKGKTGCKHYLAVMTDKRRKLVERQMASGQQPEKKSLDETKLTDISQTAAPNKTKKIRKQKGVGKVENAVQVPSAGSRNHNHGQHDVLLSSPSFMTSKSPWSKDPLLQQPPCKPPILNYDPTATIIESKYVQIGDKISREENGVNSREKFDCVVSLVNSPTNFYLVRMVKWKQLDKLFGELRDYWISHPTALCPHPQFLQPNYICLAKTDNEEEVEVYRVVILGRPDPHHYKVFCIDYGDLLTVRHNQLRYMPKDFLYYFDAQAIPCSLYNVASPTKDPATGNDVWNKGVCEYTRKLLIPNDLPIVNVLFKQRVNGTGKWLVKVSSGKREDVGEDVMKFVNKGTS